MAEKPSPEQHENSGVSQISFKKRRKQDALELAELVYDLFKEAQENGTIDSGQNNAQPTQNS